MCRVAAASAATTASRIRQAACAASEIDAFSEASSASQAATLTGFAAVVFGLAARHHVAADTPVATISCGSSGRTNAAVAQCHAAFQELW